MSGWGLPAGTLEIDPHPGVCRPHVMRESVVRHCDTAGQGAQSATAIALIAATAYSETAPLFKLQQAAQLLAARRPWIGTGLASIGLGRLRHLVQVATQQG